MTGDDLARSYLSKVTLRLDAIEVLRAGGGHSDVVRECQEVVELVLKGLLRAVGVDPPRVHDVGPLLAEQARLFPDWMGAEIPPLVEESAWLRLQRESSFYGDVDVIPTEVYTAEHAGRAVSAAKRARDALARLLADREGSEDSRS